jgi:hypothetical protein
VFLFDAKQNTVFLLNNAEENHFFVLFETTKTIFDFLKKTLEKRKGLLSCLVPVLSFLCFTVFDYKNDTSSVQATSERILVPLHAWTRQDHSKVLKDYVVQFAFKTIYKG